MPATSSYSCIIRVVEEHREEEGDEFWVITSDDLPGLLLGGRDLEALRADTPEAIRILFDKNYGLDVHVLRATEPRKLASGVPEAELSPPFAWTAIPTAA